MLMWPGWQAKIPQRGLPPAVTAQWHTRERVTRHRGSQAKPGRPACKLQGQTDCDFSNGIKPIRKREIKKAALHFSAQQR